MDASTLCFGGAPALWRLLEHPEALWIFGYHTFAHADLLIVTFAREALLGNVCSVAFLLTGMFLSLIHI